MRTTLQRGPNGEVGQTFSLAVRIGKLRRTTYTKKSTKHETSQFKEMIFFVISNLEHDNLSSTKRVQNLHRQGCVSDKLEGDSPIAWPWSPPSCSLLKQHRTLRAIAATKAQK